MAFGQVGAAEKAAEFVAKVVKAKVAARALGKVAEALPEAEIVELSVKCKKVGGLEEVGAILGKKALSNEALEDAFLRIAVKNERLEERVAQDAFRRLSGKPGLRTLIRKVNSVNDVQAKGHIHELMIGLKAEERGLNVVEFGKRFDDGIKAGTTDIDLVLKGKTRSLAIEAKDWVSDLPMDRLRADAESLLKYCEQSSNHMPVFCFRNPPSPRVVEELGRKGVESVYGTPSEIAVQLQKLASL